MGGRHDLKKSEIPTNSNWSSITSKELEEVAEDALEDDVHNLEDADEERAREREKARIV